MKSVTDAAIITALEHAQRGCFSKADLRAALAEKHPLGLSRRLTRLQEQGVLRRFVRGWYVTRDFDLATLSQRLAPTSYVSLDSILSERLLVGVRPERSLTAVKVGPNRTYEGPDSRIVHLGITPTLFFGWTLDGVVRKACAEKAVLDTLYFYQRGRRYPFDIYSDVRYDQLDPKRVEDFLTRYRNPRFVTFARKVMGL